MLQICSSLPCHNFWKVSIKTSKTRIAEDKSNNVCDATGKHLSLQESFNKPELISCVAKERSRVIDYSLNQKNNNSSSSQTNNMLIRTVVIRMNTV